MFITRKYNVTWKHKDPSVKANHDFRLWTGHYSHKPIYTNWRLLLQLKSSTSYTRLNSRIDIFKVAYKPCLTFCPFSYNFHSISGIPCQLVYICYMCNKLNWNNRTIMFHSFHALSTRSNYMHATDLLSQMNVYLPNHRFSKRIQFKCIYIHHLHLKVSSEVTSFWVITKIL